MRRAPSMAEVDGQGVSRARRATGKRTCYPRQRIILNNSRFVVGKINHYYPWACLKLPLALELDASTMRAFISALALISTSLAVAAPLPHVVIILAGACSV